MIGSNDAAGLGHNRPPQPLDPARLLDWLEPELTTLRSRRAALLEAVGRFQSQHVPITDDEEQGAAAEFVRQLRAFVRACEDLRTTLGTPYLDCTRTLNEAFKRLEGEVISGREVVDRALTDYARIRAAEERIRREAAAKAQRDAAALAELQARHAGADDAAWDRAVDTTARAEKAEKAAAAGAADLSRVRGDMGAVASLRERWEYEVIDFSAIPETFIKRIVDFDGVRAAIDGGVREIPGLRIFDASRVSVR